MPETPNYLNLMKHVLGRFDEAAAGQLTFGQQMEKDMQFVEADVRSLEEAPGKQEARLVSELMVTKDMCSPYGMVHAGCTAFLLAHCTTLVLMLLNAAQGKPDRHEVSLSTNTTYHSPAQTGAKLRIIAYSVTLGARSMSARAEIWDATNKRLVASGVHVKMDASKMQLPARL